MLCPWLCHTRSLLLPIIRRITTSPRATRPCLVCLSIRCSLRSLPLLIMSGILARLSVGQCSVDNDGGGSRNRQCWSLWYWDEFGQGQIVLDVQQHQPLGIGKRDQGAHALILEKLAALL